MSILIRRINNSNRNQIDYGVLSEKYPFESASQIENRRRLNWEKLKYISRQCIDGRCSLQLQSGDIEIHYQNDPILMNEGESLSIIGKSTNLICYPIAPSEGEVQNIFQLKYGCSLSINSLYAKRDYLKKYETYSCVLKKSSNAKLIEVLGNPRQEFWDNLEVGNTIFYGWQISVKGESNKVASWDQVAGTITLTNNISASVSNDMSGAYVKFGVYFESNVSVSDYQTYGDMWYLDEGMNLIFVDDNTTDSDAIISLSNVTIEGFENNTYINSAACKLNLHNVTFKKCQIGLAFFSKDEPNYQTITSTGTLTFQECGYFIAGGIFAATANNILGSGCYAHPSIIANVQRLVLLNNVAAAWRQFSASGTKPTQPDYASYFAQVFAVNNPEYDFLSSNSMETTIDYIESDGIIHPGLDLTINGGDINKISCFSQSQPASTVESTMTINNCTVRSQQDFAWSSDRNQYHSVYYNDCIFVAYLFATYQQMLISNTDFLKYLEINDCTFVQGDGDLYTPGGSVTGLTQNSAFIRPVNFKEVVINNLSTEYLYGYLVNSANTIPAGQFDYTIEVNDSLIRTSNLEVYNYNVLRSFSKRLFGSRTSLVSLGSASLGGYVVNTAFSPKTAVSSAKTIGSLATTRQVIGTATLSNVLEIDWDHNEYPVNTGTVNTIIPSLRINNSTNRLICSNLFNGQIIITAVGGAVTFTKFDASTNINSNIVNDYVLAEGDSCVAVCNKDTILSTAADTSTTHVAGTANGSTTVFSGIITDTTKKVILGTATITAGAVTGNIDADGNITGTGIVGGYIDRRGGAFTVEFSVAPTGGNNPTFNFDIPNGWRFTGAWTIQDI